MQAQEHSWTSVLDVEIYHSNIIIKPPLPCDYKNSSGSSMHDHFSIRRNKITKRLTETGHNNIVIKPTLQYNYNPRMDPPCMSVSTQVKQDDERN